MVRSQPTLCTRGNLLGLSTCFINYYFLFYTVHDNVIVQSISAVRWNISRNSLLTSRNTTRTVLLILPRRGSSTHHYLGKWLKHLMISLETELSTFEFSVLIMFSFFCRACVLYSDNKNGAGGQQSSVEVTDGLSKCSIRDERPRADRNAQRIPVNVPQTIQGLWCV